MRGILLLLSGTLKRFLTHNATRGSVQSVVDQGIVSSSNFLTGVIVAKMVTPDAFGIYSLMFTGIMVLSSFQNSFITGPLRVLGVSSRRRNNASYFKTHVLLQLLLGSLLVVASALFFSVVRPMSGNFILVFAVCLFSFQFQELIRIINLTRFTLGTLLFIDTFTHGLRLGTLILLSTFELLNPSNALLVIGVSSAIGVMMGLTDKSLRTALPSPLLDTASANWKYGRWILLESIAYFSSTQVYLYFIALWVDKQSAGALNAVQSLLNIVNVLLLGVISFAIPIARRKLVESGYLVWRRWLWQIGLILTTLTSLAVIVVSFFANPLLTSLYTPFYGQYAYLVPILALSYCFTAVNTTLRAAFHTANLPQIGPVAKSVSAVLTLSFAYPLLNMWGVGGAAFGLLFTQVIWTLVYLLFIARGIFDPDKIITSLSTA